MNKIILCGNLTKDLEVRTSQSGIMVLSANLAVQRKFKKEGEPTVDFFKLIAFGNTAEFMSKYMATKGTRILVEGYIRNKQWQDQNGKTVYGTDYIIESAYFADRKQDNTTQQTFGAAKPAEDTGFYGDDLPF